MEGEMPNEKVASVTVTDDHEYEVALHVVWGAKGAARDAPDGWVNAGFAEVQLREDHGNHGSLAGIMLNPDDIDRLIRTLKRVKRKIQ